MKKSINCGELHVSLSQNELKQMLSDKFGFPVENIEVGNAELWLKIKEENEITKEDIDFIEDCMSYYLANEEQFMSYGEHMESSKRVKEILKNISGINSYIKTVNPKHKCPNCKHPECPKCGKTHSISECIY